MRGTARTAGVTETRGGRVSTDACTLPAAIVGLIRGAIDTRDSTCRLGERMKPCAWTGEPARTKSANGNTAAISLAAVSVLASRVIGPQTLRKNAGRTHGVSTARLT